MMTRGWWLVAYALSSPRFQRHALAFIVFWFIVGLIIVEVQQWNAWLN